MPPTRSSTAAPAPAAVIDISSSDADDDDDEESETEDASSDEDYCIDASDEEEEEVVDYATGDEDSIEVNDVVAAEEEVGVDGGDEEEEEEVVDEGEEDACNKITNLLRGRESLDGIKLGECKAYLRKYGLIRTGDRATCIERITLHWRLKDTNPEKIYPESSFHINCKGDVCRGDAVFFRHKVYMKQKGSGHVKYIGKRTVAGRVIKESYGKAKQQHTFTIEVFWSKGVNKLQPLSRLLIKGRNLYRLWTRRQPWLHEVERLNVLEEKHRRGDAARHVRALNRSGSAGSVRSKKEPKKKRKRRSASGQLDGGAKITQARKHDRQSINQGPSPKRPRKEESQASSGQNYTGGSRDCLREPLNKVCSKKEPKKKQKRRSASGQLDGGAKITQGRKHDRQFVNQGPSTKRPRKEESQASSGQNYTGGSRDFLREPLSKGSSRQKGGKRRGNNASGEGITLGSSHAQFQARSTSSSASRLSQIQQPFFEMIPGAVPLHETGHAMPPHISRAPMVPPHINRAPMAYPNPGVSFPFKAPGNFRRHNAVSGVYSAHFMGAPPSLPGERLPLFHMPGGRPHPQLEAAHRMPHSGSPTSYNGFR